MSMFHIVNELIDGVADTAAAIEEANKFTKLDALKGYHQCPLDEAKISPSSLYLASSCQAPSSTLAALGTSQPGPGLRSGF